MRKAQGISINTIIIAALGLAVLVVLFAIFTGRIGGFTKGVQETDTCAQKCAALNLQPSSTAPNECTGTVIAGRYTDVVGTDKVCCCR